MSICKTVTGSVTGAADPPTSDRGAALDPPSGRPLSRNSAAPDRQLPHLLRCRPPFILRGATDYRASMPRYYELPIIGDQTHIPHELLTRAFEQGADMNRSEAMVKRILCRTGRPRRFHPRCPHIDRYSHPRIHGLSPGLVPGPCPEFSQGRDLRRFGIPDGSRPATNWMIRAVRVGVPLDRRGLIPRGRPCGTNGGSLSTGASNIFKQTKNFPARRAIIWVGLG